MFNKILIANRGEIAIRILKACQEMNIPAAVVYSEADRNALHVRTAAEAVCIGPAAPQESYLSTGRIIEAARRCGADAVHPGYGFLSENSGFARAVADTGLTLIGPPTRSIDLMGDKGRARQIMQKSGVPVIPGYDGPDDRETIIKKADEIGFPLLIKASGGGGGKGMHLVEDSASLQEALASARREALHAFGDERVILERFIPSARHIEFQVLADAHGNCLHVFERECSIQRRHQKIIEESPSTFIQPEIRQQMGTAAVNAALAAGYQNAGTVEFIVDPLSREFFFLEMNTRIQVEHPVTEMVSGLDLVQWQIRIAGGERLPYRQQDLIQRGHAIECRLYAEDPANNFLPSTGTLLTFIPPVGPGIRVDSGYASGDEVTVHYDPLVAKIITYGEDRPAAIRRIKSALERTVLLGITHNGQFLQEILDTSQFQAGDVHTTWVEDHFGDWHAGECSLPDEAMIAAALSSSTSVLLNSDVSEAGISPWQVQNGFRPGNSNSNSGDVIRTAEKPG